ncbi:hypothetical protein VCHC62B1_3284A, partial [Vibrio cholerae HC-62B1]
MTSRKK